MNLYLLIFLTILWPNAIISDHLTLTLTKSIGDVGESTREFGSLSIILACLLKQTTHVYKHCARKNRKIEHILFLGSVKIKTKTKNRIHIFYLTFSRYHEIL